MIARDPQRFHMNQPLELDSRTILLFPLSAETTH